MPVTRRNVLQGGVAAAIVAMFGGPGCASTGASGSARAVDFQSVPMSTADTLVVPQGYRAEALYAWGDPVGSAEGSPPFKFDASNTSAEQALQAGKTGKMRGSILLCQRMRADISGSQYVQRRAPA